MVFVDWMVEMFWILMMLWVQFSLESEGSDVNGDIWLGSFVVVYRK